MGLWSDPEDYWTEEAWQRYFRSQQRWIWSDRLQNSKWFAWVAIVLVAIGALYFLGVL